MSGLSLESVVTRFEDGGQIGPISLSVPKGEMLSLLGPSGSGKTTTLRLIAGLEPLLGGDILFDGISLTTLDPRARKVGMVFQNYGLFPHMSVEKNISFGLRMKRVSASEVRARVEDMITVMQLSGLESRFMHQLSGGQRQRVALARTLVMDPDILLLDEPLSNLDANLRIETAKFIRDLQQRLNITTVFVTHDQEEALLLADRVAVMSEGGVDQVGTPTEITDRPASPKVARFMGGKNLFNGSVISDHEVLIEDFRLSHSLENSSAFRDAKLVMIRPEHIELKAECGDGPLSDNVIVGKILEARYIGGFMSYEVQANDTVFHVKSAGRERHKRGTTVQMRIPPDLIWPLRERNGMR
ncbi:ABC transporter ATP-binding protein [Sneathiella glossodoripedis]|uniref:ABC transporter ATP-binding protein n=1 Tax=Sneathiella glossodoripedis TaxID=418853 RepID=UPI00047197C2|nr:ABC transporter ATP-binding protein [Sneathiella glossodoripedis]